VFEVLHVLPVAAGWTGATLTTSGYFLLSRGRITASSRIYQGTNIGGALLLAYSAVAADAWPSAAANVVWLAIGAMGYLSSRRPPAPGVPRPRRPVRFSTRRVVRAATVTRSETLQPPC
jgi:hypothetical protein